MRLEHDDSCLLVIDIQERLNPTMAAAEQVVANTKILLKAAHRLEVPTLVSEQYPRGLGPIVPELRGMMSDDAIVEKLHFSCMGEPAYTQRFDALDRPQVVVAGIEAHVCVLQTVMDLLSVGRDVFVVADATSSRAPENHQAALERMRADGARIVTTEMVVFEWLARAGTPEFKELSALIR